MTYPGKLDFGQIFYGSTIQEVMKGRNLPAFLVENLEDMPAPVAGVITLPQDTCWNFSREVDITPNVIQLASGACILGSVPGRAGIKTDNALPLISLDGLGNGGRAISDVSLENTSGPCISFTGSGGLQESILIDTVTTAGGVGSSVGDFDTLGVLFIRGLFDQGCEQGLTIKGSIAYVRISEFVALTPPANYVGILGDATLSSVAILFSQVTVTLSSATVTGLSLDAAITVTRGLSSDCQFPGVGVPLAPGGVTARTPSWKFSGNQGIRDSSVSANLRFDDAAGAPTLLPITAQNEWSTAAGLAWAIKGTPERMSLIGTDVLQYDGLDPVDLKVDCLLSAEHAGGGNDRFGVTVQRITGGVGVPATGSTLVDNNEVQVEFNANQSKIGYTPTVFSDVKNGEQFRLLFRNRTANANAESFSAALVVSVA